MNAFGDKWWGGTFILHFTTLNISVLLHLNYESKALVIDCISHNNTINFAIGFVEHEILKKNLVSNEWLATRVYQLYMIVLLHTIYLRIVESWDGLKNDSTNVGWGWGRNLELGSEWQQPKGQGQRGSSQRGTAKGAGPKGHQTKGALPKGHQTKGAWPKGQSQRGRTKGAWPKGHSQRGMAKGAFNTKGAGLS